MPDLSFISEFARAHALVVVIGWTVIALAIAWFAGWSQQRLMEAQQRDVRRLPSDDPDWSWPNA